MKNVKIGQLPALLDLLRFGCSEHDTGLENEIDELSKALVNMVRVRTRMTSGDDGLMDEAMNRVSSCLNILIGIRDELLPFYPGQKGGEL